MAEGPKSRKAGARVHELYISKSDRSSSSLLDGQDFPRPWRRAAGGRTAGAYA